MDDQTAAAGGRALSVKTHHVRVAIMDSARPPLEATLLVRELTRWHRIGAALLVGLATAGVGVVLILIPIIHFCAPAVALIASPIVGYFKYRKTVRSVAVETLHCPKCTAKIPVKEGGEGWPIRLHCDECGSTVLVTPAD